MKNNSAAKKFLGLCNAKQMVMNRRKFIDGLIDSERYNVVLKVMGENALNK